MTDPTAEQRVNDAIACAESHHQAVIADLRAHHLREKAMLLATICQLTLELEGLRVGRALDHDQLEKALAEMVKPQ